MRVHKRVDCGVPSVIADVYLSARFLDSSLKERVLVFLSTLVTCVVTSSCGHSKRRGSARQRLDHPIPRAIRGASGACGTRPEDKRSALRAASDVSAAPRTNVLCRLVLCLLAQLFAFFGLLLSGCCDGGVALSRLLRTIVRLFAHFFAFPPCERD